MFIFVCHSTDIILFSVAANAKCPYSLKLGHLRLTATLLLTPGIHSEIAQELCGYSQIFVTLDISSHIGPTLQEEAMKQVNEAWSGVSQHGSEKDERSSAN